VSNFGPTNQQDREGELGGEQGVTLSSALSQKEREQSKLEGQLRQRFDVVEQRLTVGRFTFDMLHPRSADALICDEEFNRDERLPYWAEIWPSAHVLAEQISTLAPALSQRKREMRMLELGCGCGLVVLTGLAMGFSVTAIDYYPEALEFVRLNALRNGLAGPEAVVVDWRKYPSELVGFDVVVAADVLYERDYCRLIAGAMSQSLRPDGLGLLTDPQRAKAEMFPGECRRARLEIAEPRVSGPLIISGGDPSVKQTVNLFEIRRAT
jgi:2-polyprenyl-3-methyl-5-hydroxy-6-metoxy-1,4-benzoquinol methylase